MDKQTEKKLLNIVQKNYQVIAEHFSETRRKRVWPELEKLTASVRDGDRVLDVGCGNGRLLDPLAGKKIVYLGLDSSRPLIHSAQALHPGYDFRVGDILKLRDLPEYDFDHVFSVAVLQHIPGERLRLEALRQLRNKIKPGGRVIIANWNMWGKSQNKKKPLRRLVLKFWLLQKIGKHNMDFGDILFDWKNPAGEKVSQRYYHAFRKRELKKLAKLAGLKIERLYKDDYNYYLVATR